MTPDPRRERLETVLLVVGVVIVAAWLFGVMVQTIFPTHVVPPEVHGVTFVVVSGLFGGAALTGRSRRNGNDS